MDCPYCGREMEFGIIHSPQELSWIKGDRRRTFARADFHEGSVMLSQASFLNGSAAAAYACKGCKKVIIDYADPSTDLNNRE